MGTQLFAVGDALSPPTRRGRYLTRDPPLVMWWAAQSPQVGRTALALASASAQLAVVAKLLERGAGLEISSKVRIAIGAVIGAQSRAASSGARR